MPPAERQLFIEQFGSDVEFLQLLFLLINRSCPIPNVELVWPEGGSANHHPGTAGALAGPCSQLLGLEKKNPQPFVCSPSGMIAIAVPVIVNGQHIATLRTGHVLTAPPTQAGFAQIAKEVAALGRVKVKQLEEAYWQMPVVTADDIGRTTEILQRLGEFLAKTWQRMTETIRERRRADRELQLSRREFAYLALEWAESEKDKVSLEEIADFRRRIGFTRSPNRVLVIRPEHEGGVQAPKLSLAHSLAAVLQVVEDWCEKLDNFAATRLSMTSICVFFHDANSTLNRSNDFGMRRQAIRILNAIRERCDLGVRIGIGNPKADWRGLAESYREACLALAGSDKTVALYRKPAGSVEELTLSAENLCRLLAENRLEEAKAAIFALPALVSRQLGSELEDFAFARLYFSSVVESMLLAARKLGCDSRTIAALSEEADAEFKGTGTLFQMHEAWLRFAGETVEEIGRLYVGKRQKIIERACRMIQSRLEQGANARALSISAVAAELGVSVSHMSRTFKQHSGQTFEQYLITKRVERAKRLLLNPLNNVSEVARRSGFSDPSYFARVFRKLVGCSPREYCNDPLGSHARPLPDVSLVPDD